MGNVEQEDCKRVKNIHTLLSERFPWEVTSSEIIHINLQ